MLYSHARTHPPLLARLGGRRARRVVPCPNGDDGVPVTREDGQQPLLHRGGGRGRVRLPPTKQALLLLRRGSGAARLPQGDRVVEVLAQDGRRVHAAEVLQGGQGGGGGAGGLHAAALHLQHLLLLDLLAGQRVVVDGEVRVLPPEVHVPLPCSAAGQRRASGERPSPVRARQ